jgi:hypothetical protein
MATKVKKTADELRKQALEMLKKAKAQEREERQVSKVKLGQLLLDYLNKVITLDVFQSEVATATGMSLDLSGGGEVLREPQK